MPEGHTKIHEQGLLRIEVRENRKTVGMFWYGKSVDRNPSEFITPILSGLMQTSAARDKRIIMDFRCLDYMNSSTITPIIKVLERAKRGSNQISLLYASSRKWQALSFSALEIFQTNDKRVVIEGR